MTAVRRIAVILAVALAAIVWASVNSHLRAKREVSRRAAFAELVDYVAINGRAGPLPPAMLEFFGLPENDSPFRQIEVPLGDLPAAEYGRVFVVRNRGETVDVILGDNYTKVGLLYLCTRDAKLLRAVAVLPPPTDWPNGGPAFKDQVNYWADWWGDRER